MKHFIQQFACLLASLTISITSTWGTQLYFEGFENNHRTSGTNSYTETAKMYGDWILSYADASTTGSPLTGSAHVIMRVAKNTTNSPVLLSSELLTSNDAISKISWNCKGDATQTLKVYYSLDNETWTEKFSCAMPTNKTEKNFTLDNVSGPVYLKFVVSVASSTTSNRDANIDDITIEGSKNSTSKPTL